MNAGQLQTFAIIGEYDFSFWRNVPFTAYWKSLNHHTIFKT